MSSSRGLDHREGLGCLVDEHGPYGLLLSHAMGRRQASLGTPVPRMSTYTYQSLRVKPLEISYSSVNFFSDRDEVLLVAEEFVLTKELGIRQCGLPTQ